MTEINESFISKDMIEEVQKELQKLSNLKNNKKRCRDILLMIENVQVAQAIDSGDIKTGRDYNPEDDEEWNLIYELLINTYEKYGCSKFENKVIEMKKKNLKESYIAFELDGKDRNHLLSIFPPKYPNVIAHHITYQFGVPKNSELPDQPGDMNVIGYVDDGKSIEALVVEINGSVKRPDGGIYHITWSLDRSQGRKPVHSNNLIAEKGYEQIIPIRISATPMIF